jgi:type II secretion system (T2SS) protein E
VTPRDELVAELGDVLLAQSDSRHSGLAALLDAVDARPGERPEDVLLDLGLVDERRLAFALAARSGRRYEGLRGFTPDHRLFLYVPLALAQRERVVPLALAGARLVTASAFLDPDLSLVTQRFPNLQLELLVTPRSEILAALRRVGL